VLIAPAADFTHRLIQPQLSDDALRALAEDGVWVRPSAYDQGYPITARLLEEGRDWSILPEDADEGALGITARVRILQGGADPDVPWRHALRLADALAAPDLVFTLIKDGDHRLSRPTDLLRMIAAVEEVSVGAASAD
jgi:pimeloyl-ACP methyl ester carboxylesterase